MAPDRANRAEVSGRADHGDPQQISVPRRGGQQIVQPNLLRRAESGVDRDERTLQHEVVAGRITVGQRAPRTDQHKTADQRRQQANPQQSLDTVRSVSADHLRQSKSRFLLLALVVTISLLALPQAADAHGVVDPVATSFLARISSVPYGLEAKVVDGDLRMWLQGPADQTVTVLDYERAPYLRFTPAGVSVNENSEMFFLNQTPAAAVPVRDGPNTAPDWVQVSNGHTYQWHEGRLQSLAGVARLPGQSLIGRWRIALIVGGRASEITGSLWFRGPPSVIWFWPIAVFVLCALAAWRLQSDRIDRLFTRFTAAAVLVAAAVAAEGRFLHGRPGIAWFGFVELGLVAVFCGWAGRRVLRDRAGGLVLTATALLGGWLGLTLVPTLLHGYTLLAQPTFIARAATVICLGGAFALILWIVRIADPRGRRAIAAAAGAAVVAGCGVTASPRVQSLPPALIAQARPIGVGPRFHPPVTGPVLGTCESTLGPRYGVHLEVFRANRVVLVPAGVGTRAPRRMLYGRITAAGCYGEIVTLDPTGVLSVRTGTHLDLGAALRSWGFSLAGIQRAYVNGRRWSSSIATIPLTRDAEIVVESGPVVPPHHAYDFPPGL